jgi:hypothetical protein
VTGVYEGEELARIRARRPTDERIGRVEKKQDEDRADLKQLSTLVHETREDVASMRGELKVLPELVDLIKQQQTDALDERKHRRERWTKVIAGVFSAGVLGAIVHAVLS